VYKAGPRNVRRVIHGAINVQTGELAHLVREAAAAGGVEIAWLPFRAPELNPCEDLWRVLKGKIAGNRVFADLAAAASRWLSDLTTAPKSAAMPASPPTSFNGYRFSLIYGALALALPSRIARHTVWYSKAQHCPCTWHRA
jgi:DDE superfamily endonuclease